MLREIGSNFWQDPDEFREEHVDVPLELLGLQGEDVRLLSSGRGAEGLVLDDIESRRPDLRKVALIPPYTCETVVEPFLARGYEVHTYSIDRRMVTAPESLEAALDSSGASVVLLHRYFGFDTLADCDEVVARHRSRGTIFVEDRTQSLFSATETLPVDYVVGSLRKWAEFPDGGYAVSSEGRFTGSVSPYDARMVETRVRASHMKHAYIARGVGEKRAFLRLFQEAEAMLDGEVGYYSISPASESILSRLDGRGLSARRRENYELLYAGVRGHDGLRPVLGGLAEGVVPLYFVVAADDRARLQEALREDEIYAPIVWPRPDSMPCVCEEAQRLYSNAICIPCDQRYGAEDMDRVVGCLGRIYGW